MNEFTEIDSMSIFRLIKMNKKCVDRLELENGLRMLFCFSVLKTVHVWTVRSRNSKKLKQNTTKVQRERERCLKVLMMLF